VKGFRENQRNALHLFRASVAPLNGKVPFNLDWTSSFILHVSDFLSAFLQELSGYETVSIHVKHSSVPVCFQEILSALYAQ
jgi:hypothetical protein